MKTGVQKLCNQFKKLDSGFRRNDKKWCFSTFYEFIKIVIERKFKEAVVPETLEIIDEIRMKALQDRGYIGGETVVSVDDDREVLVFSAWSSVDDWKTWYDKKEWEELEKKLAPHIEEPVKIRAFMTGADYVKKAFAKSGDNHR